MLNNVSIMGRLVAEPSAQTKVKDEKKITIARYRLAVERDYKNGDERPVDYIMCKAFGTDALFAEKYFHKGDMIVVNGRIFSELIKKAGEEQGRFFTGVLVQKNYLARKKGGDNSVSRAMTPAQDGKGGDFMESYPELPPLPEEDDPELPPLPAEDEYQQAYADMESPFY